MKEFFGTCVNNPFKDVDELSKVIDESKPISKKKFIASCEIDDVLKENMKEYPDDFSFSEYKNIMFFTHSCIENFFK